MARLRLVAACVAIFVLAFMLQFKNVIADDEKLLAQIDTIERVDLWNKESTLNITCNAARSGKRFIEKIYETNHIISVHIFRCPPPRDSYVELFKVLGVNVARIEEITLLGIPAESTLHSMHFESLPINTLNIHAAHGIPLLRPDADFLSPLAELRHLTVVNAKLQPLPVGMKLEVVHLKGGASLGGFGECANLKFLTLEQWDVPPPSDGAHWLAHCPELGSVRLLDLQAHMPLRILEGANRLFNLALNNCSVSTLTKDILASAKDLSQLHLCHNGITSIASDAFELQHSLKELDLSHNDLTVEALEPLRSIQSLQVLSVSNNHRLHDFCEHYNADVRISHLSLSDSGITRLCFSNWTSLMLLNLTNNNIASLEFEQLPLVQTRARALEVSLRGNPLTSLVFPEELYQNLTSHRQTSSTPASSSPRRGVEPFARISVDLTLPCTCDHHWLVRAIREDLIELRNVHCDDDERTSFASATHHFYKCPGINEGSEPTGQANDPDRNYDSGRPTSPTGGQRGHDGEFDCGGCKCYRDDSRAVIAICASESNTAMPRVKGLGEVHASGNSIQKLKADDLPETLTMLDIRDNRVSHVDERAARALFAVRARRVRLAGNPIACDCANAPFLSEMHNYESQVLDFNELMCSNSKESVRHVDLVNLCDSSQPTDLSEVTPTTGRAGLVVAGAVSVAFAVLTIVFV